MYNYGLIEVAKRVRQNAYLPYSGFKVRAAVLTQSGNVFSGSNVESAPFGLAICTEGGAVAGTISAGDTGLVSIATPMRCGACTQVLSQFSQSIEIICSTTEGKEQHFTLNNLLLRATQGISLKHV
jgi:cytidine deaminase